MVQRPERSSQPPGRPPRGRKPRPPQYFNRSSDAEQQRARARIEHVIVLMLENRSYDNLFGFLGHPQIGDLRPEDHPNPLELEDVTSGPGPPPPPVVPSPTGTPRLAFDPPHGHVSALAQMHRGTDGRYHMDGFVTSYAQKLAGREHVPIIHWRAIRLLLGGVSIPLAGAVHDLAQRAVNGSWSSWARFLAGAAIAYLVLAAASHLLRIRAIPSIQLRNIRIVTAVLAVLWSAAVLGWWRWLVDDGRGIVTWTIAVALVVQGLVLVMQDRMRVRARVPLRHLRTASAAVMRCLPPAHIPVLATLAKRYVTCSHWHSSVPGATWPNRNFAHAATSDESVDIELGLYSDDTIFDRLDEQRDRRPGGDDRPAPWRIYHHDTPQVVAFRRLWADDEKRARWFDAGQLLRDIEDDQLPQYAFVEPCHTGALANSQHPGNNEAESAVDFERGEDLVYTIHRALEQNPEVFAKTVFVVTYDEHGGLFDSVPPPATVHPERDRAVRSKELARRIMARFVEHRNRPFHFRVLGPRVPTVVISPWVTAGAADDRVYDHASIVASIRLLFAPDTEPLTLRDEYANDFLHLIGDEQDATPAQFPDSYQRPTDTIGSLAMPFPADAEAWQEEPAPVLAKDTFGDQLAKLNFYIRQEIEPASTPAEPGRGVPAAVLLKAAAVVARTRRARDGDGS